MSNQIREITESTERLSLKRVNRASDDGFDWTHSRLNSQVLSLSKAILMELKGKY